MFNFLSSFKIVGLGVLEIFILGFAGFYVLHRKILAEQCLKTLSSLVINVTLPCLIFTSVVTRFNVKDFPDWWIYPLAALCSILVGLMLGNVVSKIIPSFKEKREFTAIVGFNNTSFLPLPLVAILFPPEQAERFFVYIFLYTIAFIPLVSSLGRLLVTGKRLTRETLSDAFTPPFYTILASLIIAGVGLGKYIPHTIINPLRLLGDCTIPLAMIILGGVIYNNFKNKVTLPKRVIVALMLSKSIIFPAFIFTLIYFLNLPKEFSFLIVLEAAMPPAMTLATLAKNYDGNVKFVGQATFFTYVFSLITIPFWISLYMAFSK